MTIERPRSISIVVLALCVLANAVPAPAQQTADPWQFPRLTDSQPFQRWWWAYQQRAYPLDEIPEGVQLRALQQIEQLKASLPLTSQAVQGDRWVNIGPAPIDGGQIGATTDTRPMSGRVAEVAVNPSNSNHWLIGAAQGGIWETLDAGTTWTAKTDAQASLATGAIAFAPSNPSLIYVGTGEAVFSGDAYAGAGLLKSNANVLYVSIQDAFNGLGVDGGLLGLWRTDTAWAATPTWTQIATGATDDGTGSHGYCG
ncbi:MAG: hypothetical protein HYX97_03010 [Chloroflexi bacterium]|nr:hypothetical protein [Chloroflexota bacterium]